MVPVSLPQPEQTREKMDVYAEHKLKLSEHSKTTDKPRSPLLARTENSPVRSRKLGYLPESRLRVAKLELGGEGGMAEKKAKRDRGRILSETGWQKLDEALQQWEMQTDQRRTLEKVAAEAGLDPGTVAKIFKRREGADLSKIEQLLRKFQLNVEAIDHCPLPQGIAQSADPNFVGRAGAIADLNALVERGAKVIVIQARGGVGKTTLARKYLQQEFGSFLEFPIAKGNQGHCFDREFD